MLTYPLSIFQMPNNNGLLLLPPSFQVVSDFTHSKFGAEEQQSELSRLRISVSLSRPCDLARCLSHRLYHCFLSCTLRYAYTLFLLDSDVTENVPNL